MPAAGGGRTQQGVANRLGAGSPLSFGQNSTLSPGLFSMITPTGRVLYLSFAPMIRAAAKCRCRPAPWRRWKPGEAHYPQRFVITTVWYSLHRFVGRAPRPSPQAAAKSDQSKPDQTRNVLGLGLVALGYHLRFPLLLSSNPGFLLSLSLRSYQSLCQIGSSRSAATRATYRDKNASPTSPLGSAPLAAPHARH